MHKTTHSTVHLRAAIRNVCPTRHLVFPAYGLHTPASVDCSHVTASRFLYRECPCPPATKQYILLWKRAQQLLIWPSFFSDPMTVAFWPNIMYIIIPLVSLTYPSISGFALSYQLSNIISKRTYLNTILHFTPAILLT